MKTHVRIDPELGPCTNPDMEWPEDYQYMVKSILHEWDAMQEYEAAKSRWLSGATVPFEDGLATIMRSPSLEYKIDKKTRMPFVELKPGEVLTLDLPEWEVVSQYKSTVGWLYFFPSINPLIAQHHETRRVIRFKDKPK